MAEKSWVPSSCLSAGYIHIINGWARTYFVGSMHGCFTEILCWAGAAYEQLSQFRGQQDCWHCPEIRQHCGMCQPSCRGPGAEWKCSPVVGVSSAPAAVSSRVNARAIPHTPRPGSLSYFARPMLLSSAGEQKLEKGTIFI